MITIITIIALILLAWGILAIFAAVTGAVIGVWSAITDKPEHINGTDERLPPKR